MAQDVKQSIRWFLVYEVVKSLTRDSVVEMLGRRSYDSDRNLRRLKHKNYHQIACCARPVVERPRQLSRN